MAPLLETPWDRLRWARHAAGISARELDRLAGLAEGHSALLEAGKKKGLEMRTAAGLARALGLSLDWLVLGEGGQPDEDKIRKAVGSAQAAQLTAGAA